MIQLARVLPGAGPSSSRGVNDTFVGFILTDDGRKLHAFIKDLDIKQLANEMLAAVLAHKLGLPTPEVFLAIADDADLVCNKGPSASPSSRLVFASADMQVPNLAQQFNVIGGAYHGTPLFQILTNWADLGKVYAFDSWIANTDRHSGNMLFTTSPPFCLIDHGHSFTGPNWGIQNLIPAGTFNNRLAEWVTVCLSGQQRMDRASEAQAFVTQIASVDLDDALVRSRVGQVLTAAEELAIKSFLSDRVAHTAQAAILALGNPIIVTGP